MFKLTVNCHEVVCIFNVYDKLKPNMFYPSFMFGLFSGSVFFS